MKGWLDRQFFTRVADHLEQMLDGTASSITLRIEALHEGQRVYLEQLLDRLKRHGDRIQIAIREELRAMIEIDATVFKLVYES
jgi:ElaB/YqjD/DUF883 family membrane-anchored ribosome-binding protein